MGKLETHEVYGYSEWSVANYYADDGEEYQVTITKSYNKDVGHEYKDILNIQHFDIDIPEDDPVWKEIRSEMEK